MKPWHYRVRWDTGQRCWLVEWRVQAFADGTYSLLHCDDAWDIALEFALEAARCDYTYA
jgi:hypothetical protein